MFLFFVKIDINIPATVPGGIYSDLQSAKIIDDIYFRFNDIKHRWVANETWIYNLNFKGIFSTKYSFFYLTGKMFQLINNISINNT